MTMFKYAGAFLVVAFMAVVVEAIDCKPVGAALAGTVNRGGYEFEYESREGVNCREYRIRNIPGQPLTPVKWAHDKTVFIDTNLPACRRGASCAWMTAVQRSVERNKLPTEIGFGINKDEYIEKPLALVEAKQVASITPGGAPYASLEGVFIDANGKPAKIEFAFESAHFGNDMLVNYTASQAPTRLGSASPIIVRWGDDTETIFVGRVEPGTSHVARFRVSNTDVTCNDARDTTITVTQAGRVISRMSAPAPCAKRR